MKTFQLDGKPNVLEFTNYDREDEEVVFQKIYSILEKEPSVIIGHKVTGPSEDVYDCKIDTYSFRLIYDIDYGTVQSEKREAIERLKKVFDK